MKTKLWKTEVPIFLATLHLVVADKALDGANTLKDIFGKYPETRDPIACVLYSGSNFALVFEEKEIRRRGHQLIAHEVFHLTHRIMAYVGQRFDQDNNESHALLCEWLTKWVYSKILDMVKG